MMFENFKGFDVDDMIFGTTEQIVSERCATKTEPRRDAWIFCFYGAVCTVDDKKLGKSAAEADFSCLSRGGMIYFFG